MDEWCRRSTSSHQRKALHVARVKGDHRTLHLAKARNVYLEEAKRYLKDGNGLMVVLDCDGITKQLPSLENIQEVVNSAPSDWYALTAVSDPYYYDIWALRSPECPGDCWDGVEARKKGMSPNDYVKSLSKPVPKDAPLKSVRSAFNGFALYRGDVIGKSKARYKGERENGKRVCEHVPFHHTLNEENPRLKLYIHPRLRVAVQ